jgi:hypothetical protein
MVRGTSLVARVLDSITPKPAYSKEPPVARDIKVFLEIISGKSLNVVNLNVLSPRECLYTFFLNYLLKNPFVVVPLSFAKLMSRYREEYVISFINYIFLLKDRQLLTSLLSIGHLNTDSQVKIYLNFYDLFKNRLLSTAIKSIATDRNFLSCLASVTVSPFETFNNSLSEYLQSYIKFNETLSIVDDIKSFLDYKEYGIALGTLELEPNNIGTLGKLFTKNIEWLFSDITNTDTDKIGWYRAYYNKGITLMSDRYLTFVLGISDFAGYFNYLYVKNLRDKIAFVLEKNSKTTVHIILSRISYIVIFSYYSLLKNIYACNDLYRNSHLFNYLIQTELAKNRLEYMFSTFNILVNFIIYHQGSFIDETSIKSECLILTETVLLKLERILGI